MWADILGGWFVTAAVIRRLVYVSPPLSAADSSFVWPRSLDIATFQTGHDALRPPNLHLLADLWRNFSGSVLVASNAADLQLQLSVITHTFVAGHPGCDDTERALRSIFSETL